MKMDHKYNGEIFKNDGTVVPEDEWIVFRAKDQVVPMMLDFYLMKCIELNANSFHVKEIELLINRVNQFQYANPKRCKVPDTFESDMAT